jgi:hypothetical protein
MPLMQGSNHHLDARTGIHYLTIPIHDILFEEMREGYRINGIIKLVETDPQQWEMIISREESE